MYRLEARARFSEVDTHNRLSLGGIVDYFQDCSTFNSEDLGLGMEYMQNQDLAWVLSSWQIDVERYHSIGDRFVVGTFPYQFKGFFGYRNYFIEDEQGEKTAKASALWTLINLKTMHPVKIDDNIMNRYQIEPKLDMEYLPRKIRPIEGGVEEEPFRVKRYHLDSNQHVNNGKYIKMALEYVPDDLKIHRMRAEYRNAAKLNDVIIPVVAHQESTYVISLCDQEKKPYAVVEFITAY